MSMQTSMQVTMQIQPDTEMQQLALLFAEQQLAMQAADAVVEQESEKTLAVYQKTIAAQQGENRALQNEIAMLRQRLAAMETQRREEKALHTAETRAKDAKHAEKLAAKDAKIGRLKRCKKALKKIIEDDLKSLQDCSQSGEGLTPETRRHYGLLHTEKHDKYTRVLKKK